ncbi:MAG: haloacid dehalogenase type II [Burkholderiales bacterium]
MEPDVSSVKALTFDVFGTVVDWRGSIIREGRALSRAKGIKCNWPRFADAWRAGYAPAMDQVRRGELPWTNIDALHRRVLERLLDEFKVSGLNEAEKENFNRAWHRLKPWPDAVRGLKRLRKKFILATLSNGNMSLLTHMAKHADLPWDCILSAELVRHYKRDREVYLMAANLLDLQPQEIMMVAAHKDDLLAAKNTGFRTAWVQRPREFGSKHVFDSSPDAAFDISAADFNDLAARLGA